MPFLFIITIYRNLDNANNRTRHIGGILAKLRCYTDLFGSENKHISVHCQILH